MAPTIALRRLTAVALPLASLPLAAADTVAPINVTATRTAQTADESLASVSVITREEIERSGVQSLPDLLEREPGLSFARNGPFGKTSNLFMRGTNSDHVLVLVDGVKLGSATAGTTAFQHLPLHEIERVEIVRGPRSSLYGSEAIGGVIQIFTRRGASGPPRPSGSVMAGEHDSGEVEASVSAGDDDTRYAVSAKHFDTDGISARNDGFPDDDGYRNDSASFSVEQDFGEATTWSIRALNADGTTEFDFCGSFLAPSEDCETKFTQQVVSTRLETRVTPNWSLKLTVGQSRDETTNFTDGSFDSEFDTERDEFSWQNDITVGSRHLLTVGFDHRDDQVMSSTDFTETSRENDAVFAQWQWTGDQTNVQASLRHDDNEAFGDEDTGSIAAGYRFDEALRVYGSFGTAFKAPTFNDLFFPDVGFFRGNPDLDPEESRSVEIGVESSGDVRWSVNAFHTRIDDIIVFDAAAGTVNNLNEGEITGLELTAATEHGGWDLEGNLTLLDTEADTDDANDGNELPRRPDSVLGVSFGRDFGRTAFATEARYESERFDDAANTVELDDFVVVDMRFDYEIDENLVFEASLQNALDEEYETVDDFNALDRTFYLRLRYRP